MVDSSHVEQTMFLIRYLAKDDTEFAVQERFLTFVDYFLKEYVGKSIHALSGTRWTDRVACVRPFAAYFAEIRLALKKLLSLNLTSKTINEVNGVIKNVSSFICILMSSMLLKILVQIDRRNRIIQARDATVDEDDERGKNVLEYPCDGSDEPESEFKWNVFFVVIDSVIDRVSKQFDAANTIIRLFCILWQYRSMTEEELKLACARLMDKHPDDLSESMQEEMGHLKVIHASNFGEDMGPYQLLKTIKRYKLDGIFPNLCIALRIFCTLPVRVASAERSFSIESELAGRIDFSEIIKTFALKKACKTCFV
ncbi:uncharacterized protein LOC106467655 [Limulus polyphemus]|uniref:Uncharacterized protein LOC106467655 n=1 Tax=Limulus polyphemus TaxID=6850 RepID=A0ABM1BJY8_LIMPO|nr:uncharacterized protein LOC106467655 [Limulus polyphemus]